MKFLVSFLSLISLATSIGCANVTSKVESDCLTVDEALAKVLSVGAADVAVCGILRYRSEDRNLYSSEETAANSSRRHCISLGEADELPVNLESLDGKRVILKGKAKSNFCPADTLCLGSCSDTGIFVEAVETIGEEGS